VAGRIGPGGPEGGENTFLVPGGEAGETGIFASRSKNKFLPEPAGGAEVRLFAGRLDKAEDWALPPRAAEKTPAFFCEFFDRARPAAGWGCRKSGPNPLEMAGVPTREIDTLACKVSARPWQEAGAFFRPAYNFGRGEKRRIRCACRAGGSGWAKAPAQVKLASATSVAIS